MYTNHTPYRRLNHSIWCNCSDCKQFDYADTMIRRPRKPVTRQNNHVSSVHLFEIELQSALPLSSDVYQVELLHTVDTVTGERHDYALVSKV